MLFRSGASSGAGSILIRVNAGSVLGGTDSNVQFGTLANGNLIQYNATAGYWENVAPSSVAVTTISGGTTGLTPSTATAGAVTLGGTLATTNGGTGLTSFTANGVLYASSTSALTSGSALVYDGTILRVNGSTTSGLRLTSNSAASNGFNLYNDSTSDIAYLINYYNGSMVFGVNNKIGRAHV